MNVEESLLGYSALLEFIKSLVLRNERITTKIPKNNCRNEVWYDFLFNFYYFWCRVWLKKLKAETITILRFML